MIKISTKHLTGVKDVDNYIVGQIHERLIELVNYEISAYKSAYKRKYSFAELIFPMNYPVEKLLDKMEETREKLVSREIEGLDGIACNFLFEIISIECVSREDTYGTSRVPFEDREALCRDLFDNYGTLADKRKFINYYEDYNNYTNIIFDNYDYDSYAKLSKEELMEIEKAGPCN